MITAAYISDFCESVENEKDWKDIIKKTTGADSVIGIMSSNYLQNGLPAAESTEIRKNKAINAGVDMVLEMSLYSSISSIGIYAYSIARVIDKIKTVDKLVLAVDNVDGDMLKDISMFLVKNSREFQDKVSKAKNSGMNFYPAQAHVLEEYILGAEVAMSSWYNVFAVEMMTALKYMYSTIDIVFVQKRNHMFDHTFVGKKYSEILEYQINISSDEKMADVYGGNDILTNAIRKHRDEIEDFRQFAAIVSEEGFDVFDVRKYLMHLVLGVNKSDVSIWRMYDFAPYCRMYMAKEHKMEAEKIKKSARITLLYEGGDEKDLDRSVKAMLEFESRAGRIYDIATK